MTTRQEMMALLEKGIEKLRNREFTDEQIAKLDQALTSMMKKIEERQRAQSDNDLKCNLTKSRLKP
jgi:hypothetical protein